MPKWGIEMTEGTLTQWSVREGQSVNKGDPLLEVETDKIVNTVESPAAGILRRIVAPAGEVRPVGALIAVLAEQSVSDEELATFIAGFRGASLRLADEAAGADGPVPEPQAAPLEMRVSPVARRLADKLGLDIAKVPGSGRNGRISKEDVEAFATRTRSADHTASAAGSARTGAPAVTPAELSAPQSNRVTRRTMSATRATIARRLVESVQTIPHYHLQLDVDVGQAQRYRRELIGRSGARITLNDMLVRATALALVRHPLLNAHLEGQEILQYVHADIAVAVATDNGLMTPVVRAADLKSVPDIAREIAGLVERARRGSLTRADVTGGTFTISNLGMFAIHSFDAIINPPQVAILAVGAAHERVVVRAGASLIAQLITLTLSADHRVIDGAVGAAFLATLRDLVQVPDAL